LSGHVCMVVGGVAYLYHDGADCVPVWKLKESLSA